MFKSKKTKMGALVTRLIWGGDPDTPSPVSGLTLRDVHNVQKTWATIYDKSTLYGMELFLRLFRKNPETKEYFRLIKDLTDDQARKSFQFKAHVQNVMGAFNTAIMNLNEPEVVIALMQKLGDSHNLRHVEKKHFEDTKEVLMGILSQDLKVNDQILTSWGKFIDFMNKNIFDRLNK